MSTFARRNLTCAIALCLTLPTGFAQVSFQARSSPLARVFGGVSVVPMGYDALMQNRVIGADIWTLKPQILSANLGFEGIIGVLPLEPLVRAAGGTWMELGGAAGQAAIRALTSALPTPVTPTFFGVTENAADAMPIVFSWPILAGTLDPTDFAIHLNDGQIVTPTGVSIVPCQELNERNVAILSGEFSNRGRTGEPGAIYPVRVDIVDDGSPLMMVGPQGLLQSAVGLTRDSGNPYDLGRGPSLVGAKLSHMSTLGEQGPNGFEGPRNDGAALYGDDAQYRLRVLTTGGFSPNGVSGVLPTDFQTFFRLLVDTPAGVIELTETGIDYLVPGGVIHVVGLADLGTAQGPYDLLYLEDYDNYIDIILKGDEAAMRRIQAVDIPVTAPYRPFFNPGGPGNDPTPGVRYTEPGPRDVEPVLIALDDPLVVTF